VPLPPKENDKTEKKEKGKIENRFPFPKKNQ